MNLNLPPGRRLTKQRKIILAALTRERAHLTAGQVYNLVKKRLPQLSLGTVYRNLKFLQKEGFISGILCDACSAEHFDGFTDHCQHFICRKCQQVFDLPQMKFAKLDLKNLAGVKVENYQLNLIGICNQCLKKKK